MIGLGGGGAVASMMAAYRSNMKMLRKSVKNGFGETFFTRQDSVKKTGRYFPDKTATPAQLAEIKATLQEENRRKRTLRWTLTAGIFILMVAGGSWAYQSIVTQIEQQNDFLTPEERKAYEAQLAEYNFLVETGQHYLQERAWHNAIYQYREAGKIFPEQMEWKEGLASAATYRCLDEGQNCEEADRMTMALIIEDPGDKKAQKLRDLLHQ